MVLEGDVLVGSGHKSALFIVWNDGANNPLNYTNSASKKTLKWGWWFFVFSHFSRLFSPNLLSGCRFLIDPDLGAQKRH